MNNIHVLGNGVSRKHLDLTILHKHGYIYGCNALYRDYIPDVLVGLDDKMVQEFIDNNVYLKTVVYVNTDSHYHLKYCRENNIDKNLYFHSLPSGHVNNSGVCLTMLASLSLIKNNLPNKNIYLHGFDFIGTGLENKQYNNVYENTKNYLTNNDEPNIYKLQVNQLINVIKSYSDINYIRVVGNDYKINSKLTNYTEINIETFNNIYRNN